MLPCSPVALGEKARALRNTCLGKGNSQPLLRTLAYRAGVLTIAFKLVPCSPVPLGP